MLARIVAMLTKMMTPDDQAKEEEAAYGYVYEYGYDLLNRSFPADALKDTRSGLIRPTRRCRTTALRAAADRQDVSLASGLDLEHGRAYCGRMSAEPILATFRRLPPKEKIRLVQQLWDEIAEEASHLPLSDAQRQLLDDRINDHEANPDDVEPWDEARDDILRKL